MIVPFPFGAPPDAASLFSTSALTADLNNLSNVSMIRNAGANVVVMGTALINSTNKKLVIEEVDSL